MADNTATRVETVTANITATEAKYGPDGFDWMTVQCLKDISVSLAMLVDAGSTTTTTSET